MVKHHHAQMITTYYAHKKECIEKIDYVSYFVTPYQLSCFEKLTDFLDPSSKMKAYLSISRDFNILCR